VTRVPQQSLLENAIRQTYNGKSANYMDLISVGVCHNCGYKHLTGLLLQELNYV